MPYFDPTPNAPTLMVLAGSKTYLLGSITPDGGKMTVGSVSITSNVATVGVSSVSGVYPTVGTPITIRGTQNDVGLFNVTNVPVTAVTLDQSGSGTISFALTGADFGNAGDIGTVTFFPIVTGETAVNNSFTIAGALSRPSGARGQDGVFAQVTLPQAGVTALTATIQVSDDRINWLSTTQVLTVVAGAPTTYAYFETTALFVRAALTGLTGSGPVAIVINI